MKKEQYLGAMVPESLYQFVQDVAKSEARGKLKDGLIKLLNEAKAAREGDPLDPQHFVDMKIYPGISVDGVNFIKNGRIAHIKIIDLEALPD